MRIAVQEQPFDLGFWKKEITRAGEGWVAARCEDEDALKRW